MDDGINDGDESDRMLAVWPVHDRPAGQAHGPGHREQVTGSAAVEEVDGRPVVHEVGEADVVTVATPAGRRVAAARRPGAGARWRIAVREPSSPRFGMDRVGGLHPRRELPARAAG